MAFNANGVYAILFVRPAESDPDFMIEFKVLTLFPANRTAPIRLHDYFACEFSRGRLSFRSQEVLGAAHYAGADVRRLPRDAGELAEGPQLLPVLGGLESGKPVPMKTAEGVF